MIRLNQYTPYIIRLRREILLGFIFFCAVVWPFLARTDHLLTAVVLSTLTYSAKSVSNICWIGVWLAFYDFIEVPANPLMILAVYYASTFNQQISNFIPVVYSLYIFAIDANQILIIISIGLNYFLIQHCRPSKFMSFLKFINFTLMISGLVLSQRKFLVLFLYMIQVVYLIVSYIQNSSRFERKIFLGFFILINLSIVFLSPYGIKRRVSKPTYDLSALEMPLLERAQSEPYYPIVGLVDSNFIAKPEAMLMWAQLNPEVNFYFTSGNWAPELTKIGFIPIKSVDELPSDSIIAIIHGSSVPFASLRFMFEDLRLHFGFNKTIKIHSDFDELIVEFDVPHSTGTVLSQWYSSEGVNILNDGHLGVVVFSPGIYAAKDSTPYFLLIGTQKKAALHTEQLSLRTVLLPHLKEMMDSNLVIPKLRKRNPNKEAYVMWVGGNSYKAASKIITRSIQTMQRMQQSSTVKHFIIMTNFEIPESAFDFGEIRHIYTDCSAPEINIHESQPYSVFWNSRICLFDINHISNLNLEKVVTLDYDLGFASSGDFLFEFDSDFMIALGNPVSYGQGGLWAFTPSHEHFNGLMRLVHDEHAPTKCYREVAFSFVFHDESILGCYFRDQGLTYLGVEFDFTDGWTYAHNRQLGDIPLFAVHEGGYKGPKWKLKTPQLAHSVDYWVDLRRRQFNDKMSKIY